MPSESLSSNPSFSNSIAYSTYLRPNTLHEALTLLAAEPVQILSGGTDFYPALGERIVRGTVVDISRLHELRGVAVEPEYFRIGGLTTWTDILRAPLPRCFDGLKSAAREVGSVQIQNRGTVAGNLCNASPAADGVPPLLALDAEIELTSADNSRRMPLAEFIVGNRKTQRKSNELLTAVLIPRALEDSKSAFVKLGARRYLVISISMVAAALRFSEDAQAASRTILSARIAVGSCSAVARRLRELEHELVGVSVDDGLSKAVKRQHLSPLSPIDDVRATGEYRLDAALHLVQRALNSCVEIN